MSLIMITYTRINFIVYQCSCLVAPEDGAVSLDGVTVDSRAHFTCSKGTLLKGSITLICQYDGLWSDDPPACLGKYQ